MNAQLLRRLIHLEQREQVRQAPQEARFPEWLIREWQSHGVPVDDTGRIDWAGMKCGRSDRSS